MSLESDHGFYYCMVGTESRLADGVLKTELLSGGLEAKKHSAKKLHYSAREIEQEGVLPRKAEVGSKLKPEKLFGGLTAGTYKTRVRGISQDGRTLCIRRRGVERNSNRFHETKSRGAT